MVPGLTHGDHRKKAKAECVCVCVCACGLCVFMWMIFVDIMIALPVIDYARLWRLLTLLQRRLILLIDLGWMTSLQWAQVL